MSHQVEEKSNNCGRLVLVRHGESLFNKLNLFTGWLDVPLTEQGIKEGQGVAVHCQQFNYDAAFTSHLERAHETLLIILARQKRMGIFKHESADWYDMLKKAPEGPDSEEILPIYSSQALNERAYGSLQGTNKDEAVGIYGLAQVLKWRRSFKAKPPEGESLEDVYKRATGYFNEMILPRLKNGETNLIVSHGNTLRAIIKDIESIDDDKIPLIDLPFAVPLVYEYKDGRFNRIEGEYNFRRVLR